MGLGVAVTFGASSEHEDGVITLVMPESAQDEARADGDACTDLAALGAPEVRQAIES